VLDRYHGPRSPLGQRIKKAREDAGYTQDRLAEALNTRRHVIIRWEKGEHVPRRRHANRLAEILGGEAADYRPDPEDVRLLEAVEAENDEAARRLVA
jgi:transcriptional regulator with XRE-family HTH domain